MSYSKFFLLMIMSLLVAACNQPTQEASTIRVELIDGNVRRTYVYQEAITVDDFLRRIEANVTDLDRVSPQRFTQIYDGMTITIVRVQEEISCFDSELAFNTQRLPADALQPGEERIAQAGQNGTQRICERCIFENGVQTSCNQSSQTVLTDPKDEIIYFGAGGVNVPVEIEGRLAYIAGFQAWIMEGNATNRRVLTTAGQLDGQVFDLSPNGRQLLYTIFTDDTSDLPKANELLAIMDTANPTAVALGIENVHSGQWMPNESLTISYSTMNPIASSLSGYEAYNDLWKMRLDSRTGQPVSVENIVENNLVGQYSYWGTNYAWSPNGERLAWAKADSIGLVDLATGQEITLYTFPYYGTAVDNGWVWQPDISWSQDSQMIVTTIHGAPAGQESEINSVVFNMAAFAPTTNLVIDNLISRTGLWAQPRFSPIAYRTDFPEYQIAYLQAREPLNSLGVEHDLYIADRDGSNPRRIFPPEGRAGLDPYDDEVEFVWSPSGRQIAIIYQGNLWVVDVTTGTTNQLTNDGQASHPRWTN